MVDPYTLTIWTMCVRREVDALFGLNWYGVQTMMSNCVRVWAEKSGAVILN